MVVSLIYFILSFIGIHNYQKKEYVYFLVILFFILSSGFRFLPSPSVKVYDIALLMCLSSSILDSFKNSTHFSARGDIIAIVIYVLLIYYTITFMRTIMSGSEDISYAFKVWRIELFYLSYFTFRNISKIAGIKAIKIILFLTGIGGAFYLLQYLGVTGILNQVGFQESDIGSIARFRNYPLLTVPCIYFLVFYKKIRFRYFLLTILIAVEIFMQSRGEIIAILCSILIVYILNGQFSKIIKISLSLILGAVLFLPILDYTFSSRGGVGGKSLTDEFESGLEIMTVSSEKIGPNDIEGTFIFRMLLVRERLDYLIKTNNLLFGFGTLHEDSPRNKFNFVIGSQKLDDKGDLVAQQINTDDVAYITHVFIYGLIYLAIFIVFLLYSLKRLFAFSNISVISLIGLLLLLRYIIQSLGSDQFSTFPTMVFILFALAHQAFKTRKKIIRPKTA